jgi:hypothetical protein
MSRDYRDLVIEELAAEVAELTESERAYRELSKAAIKQIHDAAKQLKAAQRREAALGEQLRALVDAERAMDAARQRSRMAA